MIEKLWEKYFQKQGVEERDALIVHYLYLVKYAVGRIGAQFPSHVKVDDLYSSGVSGLIRAVERFDQRKNAKFESYANLLIKGSIIDELRRLDWIPRSIHQKAHRLTQAQNELQLTLGRDPSHEELAKKLAVSNIELEELFVAVRPAIMMPLDADPSFTDEENMPLSERIADEQAKTGQDVAQENESIAFLEQAIAHLPGQERQVLRLYYYEELMLKEIGKRMGLSESRVSQIHSQAILKLRTKLSHIDSFVYKK